MQMPSHAAKPTTLTVADQKRMAELEAGMRYLSQHFLQHIENQGQSVLSPLTPLSTDKQTKAEETRTNLFSKS